MRRRKPLQTGRTVYIKEERGNSGVSLILYVWLEIVNPCVYYLHVCTCLCDAQVCMFIVQYRLNYLKHPFYFYLKL